MRKVLPNPGWLGQSFFEHLDPGCQVHNHASCMLTQGYMNFPLSEVCHCKSTTCSFPPCFTENRIILWMKHGQTSHKWKHLTWNTQALN